MHTHEELFNLAKTAYERLLQDGIIIICGKDITTKTEFRHAIKAKEWGLTKEEVKEIMKGVK